jgi:hypothetical protein
LLVSNVKKEYLASGLRSSARLIQTLLADIENSGMIEEDLSYTENELKHLEALVRQLRKTTENRLKKGEREW